MRATGRFYTFLVVAFMMYLFANQTQVAWLYVTSAFIAGVVPVAWLLNRGALGGIGGERRLNDGDVYAPIHEGDELQVHLQIQAARRRAAVQVDITETCPLVAPDDPQHERTVFVPMLPAGNHIAIDYTVTVYQRGLHTFPALQLRTRAPFGLFQRHTALNVPTAQLAYPQVRRVEALAFLDRQHAAQLTHNRAGVGSEVIGVRPYQPGDSPRHVHWRSVARTGRLVSKEFAQETQPGVSIVLDRYLSADVAHHPKDNPFEVGIKAAVSVAEYAQRKRYPVHIHADDTDFAVPHGAVTWEALMQYTARVPQINTPRLAEVLERGGFRQFVVVVVATPSDGLVTPLVGLKHSGANVLVILPDDAAQLTDALRSDALDVITPSELWGSGADQASLQPPINIAHGAV